MATKICTIFEIMLAHSTVPLTMPSEIQRPKTRDEIKTEWIYKSLPEGDFIRVLKLHPGEPEQGIQCVLEIVNMAAIKGLYEAISYVWGDPKDTVDIGCNGLRVPITVSLADALRNFRRTSEPRVLWADALCINQIDKQEKGHQVKRMGEVYANAKRTLVWLGWDDQNIAKDAFALILEANAYFADSFLQANQRTSMMAPFVKPYPISMDRERWLGVTSLFQFPWFRRVWTVQESAIAEECRVYWGSASINFADILEICVWLSRMRDFNETIRNVVGGFNRFGQTNIEVYLHYNTHRSNRWQQSRMGLAHLATRSRKSTFTMLLRASRYLEASDPRDHVYAFLGCPDAIDSEGRTFVEADYTSSIDDLNLRLAYALLKKAAEGSFVLSTVRHKSRDRLLDDKHPSWLPVWHVAGELCKGIADPGYWFQAGGARELLTATQYSKSCLTVGACTFDTVIWRSNTIRLNRVGRNITYAPSNWLNGMFIDTLWDDVMQSSLQLGVKVRKIDCLRTLLMGYVGAKGPSIISDERQQSMFDTYRKNISVARLNDPEAVAMSPGEERDAIYWKAVLRGLRNASVFLTRDWRIGLAPLGDLVQVGDTCCVIFGATVPFLLTPAREGRHKLISECYIHGVMNGEIMEQYGQSDLSKHRIVLE